MSFIRIVRKLPPDISAIQGIAWGNEYIDEIKPGTEDDIPDDVIYAALLDDQGNYSNVICPPMDLQFNQHFAGWDLDTFVRPAI